jgi:hypothetical protein
LFLVMTVAAAIAAAIAWWNPWRNDPDEWVPIANVDRTATADAMCQQLTAKGIEAGAEGSVVYAVFVRRRDAPRACRLMRAAGTGLGPYDSIADYK